MIPQLPERTRETTSPVTPSDPSCSELSNSANERTLDRQKRDGTDSDAPNIVLYGGTGSCNSSIINFISGRELARTSDNSVGCMFQHQRYIVQLNEMSCALWDTTGLDKGSEGTILAAQAESNLTSLIKDLAKTGGIHLVIYCVRVTRLTKAVQDNYHLFYVTVCRKKVPVALVVTGLEHRQGGMETWWTTNEVMLRLHGMQFDAHACVTTLDVEDPTVQERRLYSQQLLRDLVIQYARFPAWKVDLSFLLRVLPAFRTVIQTMISPDRLVQSGTAFRKAIICDAAEAPVEFSLGITTMWETFTTRIGDRWYEFARMSKYTVLQAHGTPSEDVGSTNAGLLIFYTSTLLGGCISSTDIDALRTFYDIADGQILPVIVVLRGCNDEEVTRACQVQVASRYSNIQARYVSLPSIEGGGSERGKLNEMIQWLYIEQDQSQASMIHRKHRIRKRFLAGVVGLVDGLYACRRQGGRH